MTETEELIAFINDYLEDRGAWVHIRPAGYSNTIEVTTTSYGVDDLIEILRRHQATRDLIVRWHPWPSGGGMAKLRVDGTNIVVRSRIVSLRLVSGRSSSEPWSLTANFGNTGIWLGRGSQSSVRRWKKSAPVAEISDAVMSLHFFGRTTEPYYSWYQDLMGSSGFGKLSHNTVKPYWVK